MSTDTTVSLAADRTLLPGNFEDVPTGILDQTTLTGHICPDTNIVHRTADCHIVCGSDRHRHDARQDLTPTTGLTFSQINGRLCLCTHNQQFGYPAALGQELHKVKSLAADLHRADNALDSVRQHLNRGDLPLAETAFANTVKYLREASHSVTAGLTDDHPYAKWVHQHTRTLQPQLQILRDKFHTTNSRSTSERFLTAAINTTMDAIYNSPTQVDLLTADLKIVRPLCDHNGTAVYLTRELRKRWHQNAGACTYQPNAAVEDISQLLQLHLTGEAGRSQATAAATQLVQQWDTTVQQLLAKHAGTPRLIAVSRQWHNRNRSEHTPLGAAYHTHVGPLSVPLRQWHIHIVDTPIAIGLRHLHADHADGTTKTRQIIDLGNAEWVHQQAADSSTDGNLTDVLTIVNNHYDKGDNLDQRPTIGGVRNQIEATIAALTS